MVSYIMGVKILSYNKIPVGIGQCPSGFYCMGLQGFCLKKLEFLRLYPVCLEHRVFIFNIKTNN